VKELKRERVQEKKANKLAFKDEKTRQEKISLNVAKNTQGIKLL
jgi:protein LTV1